MATLWPALISAGAGLLGAVIGVVGSLIVSRRAARVAFRQVRYSQVQQLRYQAHAEIFGLITEFNAAFTNWLIMAENREKQTEMRKAAVTALEVGQNVTNSMLRNSMWISSEMARQSNLLIRAFNDKREQLITASVSNSITDDEYQKLWKEL